MKQAEVAIIGGGFSGSCLAMHLQRVLPSSASILLFDGNGFAKGAAYSTTQLQHLLNVPAGKMSAFDDLPNDFVDYLRKHHFQHLESDSLLGAQFAPRRYYHQYLQRRLQECLDEKETGIELVQQHIVSLKPSENGWKLKADNGEIFFAKQVVLALGNPLPNALTLSKGSSDHLINHAWEQRGIQSIAPDASVMIIGTGLTMIDCVLSLLAQHHAAPIIALSRHGLIPQSHFAYSESGLKEVSLSESDSLNDFVRHFRQALRKQAESGGDWRVVVDACRPMTQTLWKRWSLTEQKRFVSHLRAYWDVCRHRIAKPIADQILSLKQQGQLMILSGHLRSIHQKEEGLAITYSPRGGQNRQETIITDYLINCTGPSSNYMKLKTPLLQQLIQEGIICADTLRLGLEVDSQHRIIAQTQVAHSALFCIGPPTKGKLWEIVAVPDIRIQCKEVAQSILNHYRYRIIRG